MSARKGSRAARPRSIKGLGTTRSLRGFLCWLPHLLAARSGELAPRATAVEILTAQIETDLAGSLLNGDGREGLDAATTAGVVPQHVVADARLRAQLPKLFGGEPADVGSHACIVAFVPLAFKRTVARKGLVSSLLSRA